jgi:paraquat-inducible protein B
MMRGRAVIVGGFVLGAMALGVIAILIFGGTNLFAKKLRLVAVFNDSIAGLEVGAPVTFHGMRIGRVGPIELHLDVKRHASWIPVYLDVDLGRIEWTDGAVGGKRSDLQAAVDAGLRAQLVSQGLISGQLSVDLDYHPDTPVVLAGHPGEAFEIPTVSSDLQDLKNQLLKLNLPAVALKAQQVLNNMQRVVDDLDGKVLPLADGFQTTLTSVTRAVDRLQTDSTRTLADIDGLANESRQQIATNGRDLDLFLRSARQATDEADVLVASLNEMSSPRGDLQASLRDLAASAGSLRDLTHDLQRAPLATLLRKEK